jgi:hypothetical protein
VNILLRTYRLFSRVTSSPRKLASLQEQLALLEMRLSRVENSLDIDDDLDSRISWLNELLTPATSDHTFARIGPQADGGYVLAVDVHTPEAVVSIGVGDDTGADNDLADMGVPVFQFDHTVKGPPRSSSRRGIVFERTGLGGAGAEPPLATLETLSARTGAIGDLWLMLDAEGAEWAMLGDPDTDLRRYTQISIELHGLLYALSERNFGAFRAALETLFVNHVLVSRHDNTIAPILCIGGRTVPDVTELTLVRKDAFSPGTSLPPEELFFDCSPVDRFPVNMLGYRDTIPPNMLS